MTLLKLRALELLSFFCETHLGDNVANADKVSRYVECVCHHHTAAPISHIKYCHTKRLTFDTDKGSEVQSYILYSVYLYLNSNVMFLFQVHLFIAIIMPPSENCHCNNKSRSILQDRSMSLSKLARCRPTMFYVVQVRGFAFDSYDRYMYL